MPILENSAFFAQKGTILVPIRLHLFFWVMSNTIFSFIVKVNFLQWLLYVFHHKKNMPLGHMDIGASTEKGEGGSQIVILEQETQ